MDPSAEAVNHVEIDFHRFTEKSDRGDRVLKAVEPIIADDRVEIDVVVRDLDLAADAAGFFNVLGRHRPLAVG